MKRTIALIFLLTFSLGGSCKKESDKKEERIPELSQQNKKTEKEEHPEKLECDTKGLVNINSAIERRKLVYDQDIVTVFTMLRNECQSNIEFQEFSNELVFKLLELKPYRFIWAFNRQNSSKKELILSIIRRPINDGIDLEEILDQINKLEKVGPTPKEEIIEALEVAINKHK